MDPIIGPIRDLEEPDPEFVELLRATSDTPSVEMLSEAWPHLVGMIERTLCMRYDYISEDGTSQSKYIGRSKLEKFKNMPATPPTVKGFGNLGWEGRAMMQMVEMLDRWAQLLRAEARADDTSDQRRQQLAAARLRLARPSGSIKRYLKGDRGRDHGLLLEHLLEADAAALDLALAPPCYVCLVPRQDAVSLFSLPGVCRANRCGTPAVFPNVV